MASKGNDASEHWISLDKRRKIKLRSWRRLSWITPHPALPHGLAGAVVFVVGLLIAFSSICGNYTLITDKHEVALCIFCGAAALSAISGWRLLPRTRPAARLAFRVAVVAQLALAWVAWRLRPGRLSSIGIDSKKSDFELHAKEIYWALDLCAALSILGCNAIVAATSVPQVYREAGGGGPGLATGCGVSMGCFALALLSIYPFHLAIGGESWLTCLTEQYPQQLVGFVGYVYVPALWGLATMLFGATLVERKVITPLWFGIVFGGGAFGILATTVLLQEVHIPGVSTQRLLLPCPAPPPDSITDRWITALDTSVLAQYVLRMVGFNSIETGTPTPTIGGTMKSEI